ncbi:protein-L-isoaspartate(D-aspartate) O-methyltransferase [bacterium]|nr:protein-L-isoaspartate(D-aspartate) O-methyltransferase [bacterium]
MVKTQLLKRDIADKRVLEAFRKVPRHLFVPVDNRSNAYEDCPLPIGFGQTISQPLMVALMTQLLHLKGNEKVLEIGTGSGYQAAILAELCRDVYTIECIKELSDLASDILFSLEYKNIHVKTGDGYSGWPEEAPFDAIIITCAPEYVPPPLFEQLKIGGRLIVPLGPQHKIQSLTIFLKDESGISEKYEGGCFFVPMKGMVENN